MGRGAAGAAVCAALASGPACAQFGDFIKALQGAGKAASQADAGVERNTRNSELLPSVTGGSGTGQTNAATATASGKRPGAQPRQAGDMIADRQCSKPEERFNVMEKAAEYGGTEATLRLERLVKSDYKYDALTPDDRKMLQYLATTTIWVPVELETKLAGAFDAMSSKDAKEQQTELLARRRDAVEARLNRLKGAVSDFPTAIRVVVTDQLSDGAAAKFGGVIVIAQSFTESMSEHVEGGDLVLAHELSHTYKRHPIKKLQFELLSSREGWDLGKKVLGRAIRGATFNPIEDGVFLVRTVPQLVSFVRSVQLVYSQEQELEADACAVLWLRATGDDPAKAWSEFVKNFASADSDYAKTHPATTLRAANFNTKIASDGKKNATSAKTGKGSSKTGNPP